MLKQLKIVPSAPPRSDDARRTHRDGVLAICLSNSLLDQKRRCILEGNLGGNWLSEIAQWFTLDAAPDTAKWARQIAWALLPASLELFQRNRWLTKIGGLKSCALLVSCHGLLQQVVPIWLELLCGKPFTEAARATPRPRPTRQEVCWQPDLDHVASDSDVEMFTNNGPAADEDWADFNEKQRGDALSFSQGNPLPRLVIASIALQPQVRFMQDLLDLAGDAWRQREVIRATVTDGMLHTRLAELHSGKLAHACFHHVNVLLGGGMHGPWAALPSEEWTHQTSTMATAIMVRAACGVQKTIHAPSQQCPVALWGLLGPDRSAEIEQLQELPSCMQDPFTKSFWQTSKGSWNHLNAALACFIWRCSSDIDISEQECKHGSIRRAVNARSQTWARTFSEVSASWVLQQLQQLTNKHNQDIPTTATTHPTATGPPNKKARWSGGAGRSFFNEFLKGKKLPDIETRRATFKDGHTKYSAMREEGGAELQRHTARGQRATLAAQAGGPPFGHTGASASVPAASVRDAESTGFDTAGIGASVVPASAAEHPILPFSQAGLEKELLQIKHYHTQALAGKRRELSAGRDRLSLWSAAQPQPPGTTTFKAALTPCNGPHGIGAGLLQHMVCIPPIKELVAQAETQSTKGYSDHSKKKTVLDASIKEAWQKLHHQVHHRHVTPLGKVLALKVKLCYFAGFCMCGKEGAKTRLFVASLQGILRTWLTKGSAVRRLHDWAAICIKLFTSPDDGSKALAHFYHLGFGNLMNYNSTMTPLLHHTDGYQCQQAASHGRVACRVQPASAQGFGENLWEVARGLDKLSVWHCTLMRFHTGTASVHEFIPAEVQLEAVRPEHTAMVWQACGHDQRDIGNRCRTAIDKNPWAPDRAMPLEAPEVDLDYDSSDAQEIDSDASSDNEATDTEAKAADTETEPDDDSNPWDLPHAGTATPNPEEPIQQGAGLVPMHAASQAPAERQEAVPDTDTVGYRPRPGDRAVRWGPFSISKIMSHKVHVGYVGNCYRHHDQADGTRNRRKCHVSFGRRQGMSPDLCMRRCKLWLLRGLDIGEGPLARTSHRLITARTLDPGTDEELDAELTAKGFPL